MQFNPTPDEAQLKIWGNLAYIDDTSREQVLKARFGKYKEARAEALKFVERERIRWALLQSKNDSRDASRLIGMNLTAFEKKANYFNIKFIRG